jgi:hypothetical protein
MVAICEDAQHEGYFLGKNDLDLPVRQLCGLQTHLA